MSSYIPNSVLKRKVINVDKHSISNVANNNAPIDYSAKRITFQPENINKIKNSGLILRPAPCKA